MAESFVYRNKHLSGVIELLKKLHDKSMQASGDDPEGELSLGADSDRVDLARRMLNGIADGKVAGDTDRGIDRRASDAILSRARDARMNGAGSPLSGCGDYRPGRAPPLAADGSVVSIDSIFRHDGAGSAASVSIDDVFSAKPAPPVLANG